MHHSNNIQFSSLIESGNSENTEESKFTYGKFGFEKEEFCINSQASSKKYKKPIGKYSLLKLKDIIAEDIEKNNYYKKQLMSELRDYIGKVDTIDTILVVGLGNRHISADSLGTQVIKNIIVTRNLIDNVPNICAIAPSVMGLTGIETSDTISGIISKIKPTLIIMIDTLCASDVSRLGISFQISNTPITPGSGIKNSRKKLKTSVKTISIGVPLVVYSSTFIKSAINNAKINIENITDNQLKSQLKNLLNNNYNELVTLNEIEYVVSLIGRFIADAINSVVLGEYNIPH